MTDVIIFHTDEQGNKTACIMSNSNTAFDLSLIHISEPTRH